MCGRYASARKRIELLEEFSVQNDRVAEDLKPDYNVAPTKPVYAVLTRQPDDRDGAAEQAAADTAARRQLRVVRWGLVPFWAKDVKIGSRMINARAETVAEKPAFRRAFAGRRCLLPGRRLLRMAAAARRAQAADLHQPDGRQLAGARRALRAVAGPVGAAR